MMRFSSFKPECEVSTKCIFLFILHYIIKLSFRIKVFLCWFLDKHFSVVDLHI